MEQKHSQIEDERKQYEDVKTKSSSAEQLYAQTVLTLAEELEILESEIKQEILEAARQGNVERVHDIVSRWNSVPVEDVLNPHKSEKENTRRKVHGQSPRESRKRKPGSWKESGKTIR